MLHAHVELGSRVIVANVPINVPASALHLASRPARRHHRHHHAVLGPAGDSSAARLSRVRRLALNTFAPATIQLTPPLLLLWPLVPGRRSSIGPPHHLDAPTRSGTVSLDLRCRCAPATHPPLGACACAHGCTHPCTREGTAWLRWLAPHQPQLFIPAVSSKLRNGYVALSLIYT